MSVQDYPSRLSLASSRKMGTFSYLPPMDSAQIRRQIEWIVQNHWNPAIEHSETEYASHCYWYMWKLPMFGEANVDNILAEIEACHEANPGHHVRLVGYDNYQQTQGASMVVHRGTA